MIRDTSSAANAPSGKAFVKVLSMAGNVLAELWFDVGHSFGELKRTVMPIISPNATTSAKLMLLFDGAQPNDEHTLASVGVCALETMHFTALIQDPELMAKKEMEDSYRYALDRSRQEAAEA